MIGPRIIACAVTVLFFGSGPELRSSLHPPLVGITTHSTVPAVQFLDKSEIWGHNLARYGEMHHRRFEFIPSNSPGALFLGMVCPADRHAARNRTDLDDAGLTAFAHSLWFAAIDSMSSILARLEFISTLRKFGNGKYAHYGLELAVGEGAGSELVRHTHGRIFAQWMQMSLADKMADIGVYLGACTRPRSKVIATSFRPRRLLRLVPESASGADRALFLADMTALGDLLADEYGVALRRPARQRPALGSAQSPSPGLAPAHA